MKNAKIILIIVIIIISLVTLTSCNYSYYSSWANYKEYAVSGGNFTSDEVSSIKIDWINGNIEVVEADVETFTVYEESNRELKEEEKLRLLAKDGVLDIKYSAPRLKLSNLDLSKTLYVQIPKSDSKNIQLIDIEAVSAGINIKNITSAQIDIESVSGKIVLDTLETPICNISSVSGAIDILTNKIANLDMKCVSGKAKVANSEITDFSCEIVSGDIDFTSTIMPAEIYVDGVSSRVNLKLPENSGFRVDYSTVSGEFSSNFATTAESKGKHTYGDGKVLIKVETISGNLIINKL